MVVFLKGAGHCGAPQWRQPVWQQNLQRGICFKRVFGAQNQIYLTACLWEEVGRRPVNQVLYEILSYFIFQYKAVIMEIW